MKLERYRLRTRLLHAAVYVVTLLLLFTGLWLLTGQEGNPSPLAKITGFADTSIHTWLGWALLAIAVLLILIMPKGLLAFVRETFRYDKGDARWLFNWPRAIFTGSFNRHEGHFDPGQRIANVLIVACLTVLVGSGVGLVTVHGGTAFVWLVRIHTWATYVVITLIAGHILIALGVLPGYRGVWHSMHLRGRIPEETARRVWPGWTERVLADRAAGHPHAERTKALQPQQTERAEKEAQAEDTLEAGR